MSRRTILTAFVATAVLGGGVAPVFAGSISGSVRIGGGGGRDAVVYIDEIAGATFEPPTESVVMDQTGKMFSPRVLPVLVGTTVDFLNSDPFSHNVFSPEPCPEEFDLGAWATGDVRSHTFTERCVAVILCNVHPEMDGYVVVVGSPYYAVTEADGSYSISGVPDGSYTIAVWHERLRKTHTESVQVTGSTTLDFSLSR